VLTIILIVIAIIGGMLAAIQAPFVGLMGQRLGIAESVFISFCGGTILVSLPLLLSRGGNLGAWRDVPWYVLLAGPLGVAVIGIISLTAPRLGVATTLTLVVVAQLIMGALLDHFGLLGMSVRPLDWGRYIGLVTLLLGTWLMVR
jgi:transporter family-2 protein